MYTHFQLYLKPGSRYYTCEKKALPSMKYSFDTDTGMLFSTIISFTGLNTY